MLKVAIGLIFPVYLYGPPLIVGRFLEKLEISENQYVFYIAVHGGYPAQTIRVVRKLIEKNRGHLDCGFCLKMPGNCIIDYDPPTDELINEIIISANDRIRAIAEMVKDRTRGVFEKGNPVTNWILTGIFYRLLIGSVPNYSKKYVVEDFCTGCGTCVSVCQMNNVKLEDEKPAWGTSCEMCLSCIQNCPVEAIQWGNRTKKRKRYRNPEISTKELIEQ